MTLKLWPYQDEAADFLYETDRAMILLSLLGSRTTADVLEAELVAA